MLDPANLLFEADQFRRRMALMILQNYLRFEERSFVFRGGLFELLRGGLIVRSFLRITQCVQERQRLTLGQLCGRENFILVSACGHGFDQLLVRSVDAVPILFVQFQSLLLVR